MKKTIIIIAFSLVASVNAFAQNSQQNKPQVEKPIPVLMTPSQISLTQQVLKFTYDALLTSDAPSKDVQQVRKAIEGIFQIFVEQKTPADSAKKSQPIKK